MMAHVGKHKLAAIAPAAGEAAQTATEEAHKGLPQFDPSSFASQVFWLAIMFAIMYVVFSKSTLPKISRTLQKRQAHIEHDLTAAQKMRESAEVARAKYERAIGEAQQKSLELYKAAETEVKAKLATGVEGVKSRSVTRIQEMEREIDQAKKDAMDGIHTIAAEIAAVAAKKIVGVSTDIDQAKNVVRNINKKAA